MKKTEFISKLSASLYKTGFKLKKHSPEILVVAGVIGTVASAVIACKATTKAGTIIEKTKESIEAIHTCESSEELNDEYTQEDIKKDLAIVYVNTGIEFAKLYAPSIILGTLSITSILMSHNIISKRCIALSAAYSTVAKGFKEYRGRVVERFGEDVDRELKYNIKAKKLEGTIVDAETGKEKKVKETVNVVGIDGYSDYARFFDEGSPNWEKDSDYNLMFLRAEQNYANDRLKARGYLFLNEKQGLLKKILASILIIISVLLIKL